MEYKIHYPILVGEFIVFTYSHFTSKLIGGVEGSSLLGTSRSQRNWMDGLDDHSSRSVGSSLIELRVYGFICFKVKV